MTCACFFYDQSFSATIIKLVPFNKFLHCSMTNSTSARVTALFLDVGGVMLTNGWDRKMREAAAKKFNLDLDDLNDRHRMTFDTYETGKLSLDEYLKSSVFYKDRPFTMEDFRDFMFSQSV